MSQIFRPARVFALVCTLVACAALPAIASASTKYTIKWNKSTVLQSPAKGGLLQSVSCAPTTATAKSFICAVGDHAGNVWVTEHPARSASSWHRLPVDANGGGITGVSCPSTTLCVAVDANGQVVHSTTPYAGTSHWTKPIRIDTATYPGEGYAGFAAIDCPTTTLCVAVDNSANGQVAWTTDPRGGTSAWQIATVAQDVTLNSVSCASATLCVLGGSKNYYSTTPTGGASAWKASGTLTSSPATTASLTCPTAKLCLGVGYGNAGTGLATASATPSLGAGGWQVAAIGQDPPAPGTGLLDGVSCPATNFCVAVDTSANAYTTSTPVRGNWSGPVQLKPNSQSTVSAVSCNMKLCVEVDNRGTATYAALTP